MDPSCHRQNLEFVVVAPRVDFFLLLFDLLGRLGAFGRTLVVVLWAHLLCFGHLQVIVKQLSDGSVTSLVNFLETRPRCPANGP